ncbi:DUF397 domain-containing protein [Streptomyces sp. Isolate_219]|uniref:DUF397 domain-containing protein n=1 Tax=Streptomyces sp. Isolate_219 TaxID=2950110 RepID=UPI0021C9ABF5|nr:DUF397 domain-containing protein [Streptomyces sp. Isolate_219]MCR8575438.1 DUF397 domain-containing protein [Streptomyces sp. Isolate_219]
MTERTIPSAAELTGWRKSSYSGSSEGSCIEVLDGHPSGVPVRDSKNPQGPAIVFAADGWIPFVDAVRNGELPGVG